MSTRNYYEVLGLALFADGVMVDQAYWHLAKTYQTLAVTDPRARLHLDELNEAYGVLGTPRLREEYDETLGQPPAGSGRKASRKPKAPKAKAPSSRGIRLSMPRWRPFGQQANVAPAGDTLRPLAMASRSVAVAEPVLRAAASDDVARSRKTDVGDLRASTAKMLERWRTNAGIRCHGDDGHAPDTTLVDIFKTEKELEAHGDPLAAVMEILRAPADVIPAKTEG